MLWLKAFHIIAIVMWFAGLLYLPRLFVYHAGVGADDSAGRTRFVTMERRLLMITHVGAVLALVLGVVLLGKWSVLLPGYLSQGWLHAKLGLVALVVVFHIACMLLAGRFARGGTHPSPRALKLFNEIPALLLIGIVVLVVVKPF